jgi:RNA polymerase sigma-70 factor (ECF subfamily)
LDDLGQLPAEREDGEQGAPARANPRIEVIVRTHYSVMWRLARRWGLSESDADDVAQQAVIIASRRLAEIAPGAERAFLFRATLFLASKVRRNRRRRGEEAVLDWDEIPDDIPDPERLLEQRRARAELDAILEELPEPLRAAFVLFELEHQSQAEVAEVLQIPVGTVASRVRRSREIIAAAIARSSRRARKLGGRP